MEDQRGDGGSEGGKSAVGNGVWGWKVPGLAWEGLRVTAHPQ